MSSTSRMENLVNALTNQKFISRSPQVAAKEENNNSSTISSNLNLMKRKPQNSLPDKPFKKKKFAGHKKIKWENPDKLFEMRFFRKSDVPRHHALTEDDLVKMRDFLEKHGAFDAEKSNQEDNANNTAEKSQDNLSNKKMDQQRLDAIKETVTWYRPKFLQIPKRELGGESKEKEIHAERILEKIACYYARDYQIPDVPKINVINTEAPSRGRIMIPTNTAIEGKQTEVHSKRASNHSSKKSSPLKAEILEEEKQRQFIRNQLKKEGKKSILKSRDNDETFEDIEKWGVVGQIFNTLGIKPSMPMHEYISKAKKCLKEDYAKNKETSQPTL